ncbi:MAG: hypothetical protein H6584_03490 [Flavobacteriales bacterium]|nr:hypothetical protein [Flavobacteriales bacterium]
MKNFFEIIGVIVLTLIDPAPTSSKKFLTKEYEKTRYNTGIGTVIVMAVAILISLLIYIS